jgi:hypothetical protein
VSSKAGEVHALNCGQPRRGGNGTGVHRDIETVDVKIAEIEHALRLRSQVA